MQKINITAPLCTVFDILFADLNIVTTIKSTMKDNIQTKKPNKCSSGWCDEMRSNETINRLNMLICA